MSTSYTISGTESFTITHARKIACKVATVRLKFVRDISTKMTLSSFLASVSVRDLSTNSSADSGI
jgi:hypothetical protein